jgi:Flp pilus assembly pilin Flp
MSKLPVADVSNEYLYRSSKASYSPAFPQGDACMTHKRKNEKGVTVVEYAIMLALIAIAVAVAAPNITSAVMGVQQSVLGHAVS